MFETSYIEHGCQRCRYKTCPYSGDRSELVDTNTFFAPDTSHGLHKLYPYEIRTKVFRMRNVNFPTDLLVARYKLTELLVNELKHAKVYLIEIGAYLSVFKPLASPARVSLIYSYAVNMYLFNILLSFRNTEIKQNPFIIFCLFKVC